MDTPWYHDDLTAAVAAGPDAIAVPKVGSADQVRTIAADMEAAGAPADMRLWAMIETPRAVLDCLAIAEASPRLAALVMGTNDLTKELQAQHVPGRAPVTTALQMCLLAARAAGKVILDGVYNDVRDAEGFRSQAEEAYLMGFDGKTLIHPSQVGPANEVFAPSQDEVEDARGVLDAWETGDGSGVVTYQGRMIENLHVDTARRILALADAISAAETPRD
jgi:citrate lyase subunit beta/citryl-CoA lyase